MNDLTKHLRELDTWWEAADPKQQQEIRRQYRHDGWKVCDHLECRPWDCRRR